MLDLASKWAKLAKVKQIRDFKKSRFVPFGINMSHFENKYDIPAMLMLRTTDYKQQTDLAAENWGQSSRQWRLSCPYT